MNSRGTSQSPRNPFEGRRADIVLESQNGIIGHSTLVPLQFGNHTSPFLDRTTDSFRHHPSRELSSVSGKIPSSLKILTLFKETFSVPILNTPSSETTDFARELDFQSSTNNSSICTRKSATQISDITHLSNEDQIGESSNTITTGNSAPASPLARLRGSREGRLNLSMPTTLCSTVSFLDDDWLRERVEVDENMAQVAAGFMKVYSRGTTLSDNKISRVPNESASRVVAKDLFAARGEDQKSLTSANNSSSKYQAFNGNFPPDNYVCKLCNVRGHWLQQCPLFEPHQGYGEMNSTEKSPSGRHPPPGNYICRLCGVPGHWIEQCARFQPRREFSSSFSLSNSNGNNTSNTNTSSNSGNSNNTSGNNKQYMTSTPPRNYVCNLCHRPGHWIQQCAEFVPVPSSRLLSRNRPDQRPEDSRFFN